MMLGHVCLRSCTARAGLKRPSKVNRQIAPTVGVVNRKRGTRAAALSTAQPQRMQVYARLDMLSRDAVGHVGNPVCLVVDIVRFAFVPESVNPPDGTHTGCPAAVCSVADDESAFTKEEVSCCCRHHVASPAFIAISRGSVHSVSTARESGHIMNKECMCAARDGILRVSCRHCRAAFRVRQPTCGGSFPALN